MDSFVGIFPYGDQYHPYFHFIWTIFTQISEFQTFKDLSDMEEYVMHDHLIPLFQQYKKCTSIIDSVKVQEALDADDNSWYIKLLQNSDDKYKDINTILRKAITLKEPIYYERLMRFLMESTMFWWSARTYLLSLYFLYPDLERNKVIWNIMVSFDDHPYYINEIRDLDVNEDTVYMEKLSYDKTCLEWYKTLIETVEPRISSVMKGIFHIMFITKAYDLGEFCP